MKRRFPPSSAFCWSDRVRGRAGAGEEVEHDVAVGRRSRERQHAPDQPRRLRGVEDAVRRTEHDSLEQFLLRVLVVADLASMARRSAARGLA